MPLLRLLSIALCVCVGLDKLKASAFLLKTSTTQHACICNTNHPQLVIFECPDRTSQIIGFLYLQDSSFSVDLSPSHCKAIAPSVISPEGWFPVIHDRKVGFIRRDSGVNIQSCPGPNQTLNGIQPKPCQTFLITGSPAAVTLTPHPVPQTTSPRITPSKQSTTSPRATPVPSTSPRATHVPNTQPPPTTTTSTTNTTTTKGTTTTSTSSTSSPRPLPTTLAPPTTPQSSNTYDHTCNNVEVVIDLGKHEPIYHEHARPCSGGDSMNEAVLMKYCFAPKPSNWTQGRKVIEHCSDIPPYTPINMFGFGQNLVISGIFIKCTSATDFMIIHQKDCVGGLHLDTINIQNGSGMFYVIHW
ncbi:uncharacterized protein LOC128189111 isoform X1 [Crassostrea angulata]|uniref:uncharacterized protein LOC128189111 isoform X1 n=1 Tax=Magallana angulata TaxID=2784310 RepID=UPI0022B0DE50|nr:uncharacterized protein LOC128189111 isoform X1 [Crassostrea angulata]